MLRGNTSANPLTRHDSPSTNNYENMSDLARAAKEVPQEKQKKDKVAKPPSAPVPAVRRLSDGVKPTPAQNTSEMGDYSDVMMAPISPKSSVRSTKPPAGPRNASHRSNDSRASRTSEEMQDYAPPMATVPSDRPNEGRGRFAGVLPVEHPAPSNDVAINVEDLPLFGMDDPEEEPEEVPNRSFLGLSLASNDSREAAQYRKGQYDI
ncbi:hypothetical protein AGDE_16368 [Angomonas deanei]|uniref:Uncharacterized protein n=1 Tax=Angomonas deanei TaxID=59799 RepID=A0A7G2C6T4_9TRYP|nr:hypothetical protein AGDE_16368 [Angomonas deanei]CAD2213662.1 hypothetical protein, conserved [Angomonas deanei]|eukprot:EPY17204.1 hypothetical protein AGDE_16368 [Angomonas deanei]